MRKSTDIIYCVLCNTVSIREWWYRFRKPESSDPEKMITLCKMKIIKKRKIDEFIINVHTYELSKFCGTKHPLFCFLSQICPQLG